MRSQRGGQLIVQKYGGSSVADASCLFNVARRIVLTHDEGHPVCAVVSARGDTTDELLRLASEVSPHPSRRELDVLLSAGERISCSLLAMAIERMGHDAISFTGSQAGIITDDSHGQASIVELRTDRLRNALSQGRIALVAGFQGISRDENETTLGRGGSDTTAVALSAELGACVCEIYTDVDGVYTANPSVVAEAYRLEEVSYEEMLELAAAGAEVLASMCVELALQRHVAVHVRSSFSEVPGTWIRSRLDDQDVTAVCGVTCSPSEVCIRLPWHAKVMPAAVRVLQACRGILSDLGIAGWGDDEDLHLTCYCRPDDVPAVEARLGDVLPRHVARQRCIQTDVSRVSVVGSRVSKDPTVVKEVRGILAEQRLSGIWLARSGLRASCAVPASTAERAVAAVHAALIPRPGLDAAGPDADRGPA